MTSPDRGAPQQEGVRKLVAIMFTDMKDFSKRMQADEELTLRVLSIHDRFMRQTVKQHGGTVIKTVGDAFLVSFESVVLATQCAIRVQEEFHEHNGTKAENEKIHVRIGVHLGDVLVRDNDVFGDGVNIASRIQSLADPGGVAISGSVYEQVKNKLDIRVSHLGMPQLKNIREPVKVYQVVVLSTAKQSGVLATNFIIAKSVLKRKRSQRFLLVLSFLLLGAAGIWRTFFVTPDVPESNSLAILPFVNLSDSTHEYFVDGITEDLIGNVSQIPQLLVISRASSFHFKKSSLSGEDVAKSLHVRYLLSGSVKVSASAMILDVRLTDALRGIEIWPRRFENPPEDLHWVKDDITREVAQHLRLKILAEHATRKASAEVSDLYYRGLFHARSYTKEENMYAISYFKQVIDRDSSFLPARLRLARAELINVEEKWDTDDKWIADATRNARQVLERDSSAGEAYEILGRLEILRGAHGRGIELLEKSIRLNPNAAAAYAALGVEYAFNRSDAATAVTYFLRAQELEPMEFFHPANLGIGYAMMRDYQRAAASFRRSATLNPAHENPWINLGYVYERMSEPDSALTSYRVALQKNSSNPQTYENISDLLLASSRYEEAESLLAAGLRYNPGSYRLLYRSGVAKLFRRDSTGAKRSWAEGLQLVRRPSGEGEMTADRIIYAGLFNARKADSAAAVGFAMNALSRDSSDNEVVIGVARIYAILGADSSVCRWFARAKRLNPEYDAAYLATAVDFDRYRANDQLLAVAKE